MNKLGSFYIIDKVIYFNRIGDGLDHPEFWKKIVFSLFEGLAFETKKELAQAVYGTDRGRVTCFEGKYQLLGTPNCKVYENQLKEIFELDRVAVDWFNDGHYRIKDSDKLVLAHCLKLCRIRQLSSDKVEYVKGVFI